MQIRIRLYRDFSRDNFSHSFIVHIDLQSGRSYRQVSIQLRNDICKLFFWSYDVTIEEWHEKVKPEISNILVAALNRANKFILN